MDELIIISGIITISVSLILVIVIVSSYRKKLYQNLLLLNNIPSKIYQSKYGDVEYLLEGEGPTILISHGITGGIDQGIGMMKSFLGSGYRFLYISRFGYLKSSIPDNPTVELQADLYNELLEHLAIRSIFVLGNSAGGTSAIHFAIRYPEKCKGLILLSTNAPLDVNPGNPPKFVFRFDFLYWFFMKIVGQFMLSMFVPKSILQTLSKERKNQIMDDIYFSSLPISKRSEGIFFDMIVSNPSINTDVPFESIKSPTLIINAKDDPATRVEGAITLSKEIKTSSLIVLESGGHLLLDREYEVKTYIEDFIKKD